MQRERGGRDNFNSFSSPFGGIMSSIFWGRDPFDDPFFTCPFTNSSQSSVLHPRTPSDDLQQVDESNSPVIQEIDMDDEEEAPLELEEDDVSGSKKKRDRAYANRNPLVEHPEDQTDDHSKNKIISKDVTRGMKDMKLKGTQSKTQSMSYRRVAYGGIDGTYYTATTTRRAGSDGRVLEESKQADRTTGQATHRVSRGIHDKGHSLTRKLASDGKVDTMQTLHNLEEDELAGFEQTWKDNADKDVHGWKSGPDFPANAGTSSNWLTNWEAGFRDPFSGVRPTNNSSQPGTHSGRAKKVVRINIE
ncbi:uncharacterized protein LOC107873078 [Capsicum annuum]|uniref:uncharacterized protein LOC107873078 n=1 Tax=Capsicum annuum TaxID=4072 RepID=UPI0007BF7807|nr:uncharacterized protein LOC107873078 [Capsicum annuum]XP_047252191.1 uncharacterized protein LOC107873078 [Capsicum annuum]